MYKRIMVALDGSKTAEESIPVALALSKKLDAQVYLIQVCEIFALMQKDKQAEEKVLSEKSKEYLSCILSRIESNYIKPTPIVVSGNPGEEICKFAARNQIDLIVMTSYGLSGFTGWAIGSVSDEVVKCANIPVLLVRPKNPDN